VLRLVGMSLKQTIKGPGHHARYGGRGIRSGAPNTALRQALTVRRPYSTRRDGRRNLKKKSIPAKFRPAAFTRFSVGVSMLNAG